MLLLLLLRLLACVFTGMLTTELHDANITDVATMYLRAVPVVVNNYAMTDHPRRVKFSTVYII